jgi:hypothetical protein
MDVWDYGRIALYRKLHDIVGSRDVTNEQREQAWQQLLLVGDIHTFSVIIAARFSWITIPDDYKEKAWQELLKRGIQDDESYLKYLSVNAPHPWGERAIKLRRTSQENKIKN